METLLHIIQRISAVLLLLGISYVPVSTTYAAEQAATSSVPTVDGGVIRTPDPVISAPLNDVPTPSVSTPSSSGEQQATSTSEAPVVRSEATSTSIATPEKVIEKKVEAPAVEKPAMFIRTKIEPVAASHPSFVPRATPLPSEPGRIQALSPIKPPPLHQVKEIIATSTEIKIEVATSTTATSTPVTSGDQTTQPVGGPSGTSTPTMPVTDTSPATTTPENPATSTDAHTTPIPTGDGSTVTSPDQSPLAKPEDDAGELKPQAALLPT